MEMGEQGRGRRERTKQRWIEGIKEDLREKQLSEKEVQD